MRSFYFKFWSSSEERRGAKSTTRVVVYSQNECNVGSFCPRREKKNREHIIVCSARGKYGLRVKELARFICVGFDVSFDRGATERDSVVMAIYYPSPNFTPQSDVHRSIWALFDFENQTLIHLVILGKDHTSNAKLYVRTSVLECLVGRVRATLQMTDCWRGRCASMPIQPLLVRFLD